MKASRADPGLGHTRRIWLVGAWHVARAGLPYLSYGMFRDEVEAAGDRNLSSGSTTYLNGSSPRPNASREGVSMHRQTLTTILAMFSRWFWHPLMGHAVLG